MAVETTKWGILYCPKTGISNKRKRWEKIQKVLDERKVDYDFVQSETSDSVERLMKRCGKLSDDGGEGGEGEHRAGCHPQWRDE